MTTQLGRK